MFTCNTKPSVFPSFLLSCFCRVAQVTPLSILWRNCQESGEVAQPAVETRPARGALRGKCRSPSIYQELFECLFWLLFLTRPPERYEKFLAAALHRDTCSVQHHRLPYCFGAAKNNIWGGFLSPAGRRIG